jgi:hypothetical protein
MRDLLNNELVEIIQKAQREDKIGLVSVDLGETP